MGKVVGPGSLNIDLTGYTPHLPVDGETVTGSSFHTAPGGKGGNQMTAAFRAGAETVLIGCIGNESLNAVLLDHYRKEGMRMDHVRLSETSSTGVALIEVDEVSGQNRILVVHGANMEVGEEDILNAENEFADARVVLTQFETTMASVLKAKEMALKYGIPFVLNPAPFVKVDPSVFQNVDYLTPNETEAEFYTGVHIESIEDARKAAGVLLQMGVRNVIITLGVKGSFYTNGTEEIILPALKVKAVDTTGAGDAFNGGFAAALSDGMGIEDALKYACCTASISVTRKGAAPSMPYKDEILALMKEAY